MAAKGMHVLVGGGRGFIGSYITKLLRERGHSVTMVSRKRQDGAITWNDIEIRGLPEGCDAVINVAGENLMNPLRRFNDEFKKDLIESRFGTNETLVKAIKRSSKPPSVFITSSAVSYYELDPDARYTEESPSTGQDFLSKFTRDWEESAVLPESVPTRQAVVRIGLSLARQGGIVANMILPFFLGVGGPTGSGKQWFPWIHTRDTAGIYVFAMENDHVSGPLNAVAPGITTNKEFAREFGRALWRPAIIPAPGFVLRCVFGEERAKIMLDGPHVSPKRTQELGYEFIYPNLPEACKEFSYILPMELKL